MNSLSFQDSYSATGSPAIMNDTKYLQRRFNISLLQPASICNREYIKHELEVEAYTAFINEIDNKPEQLNGINVQDLLYCYSRLVRLFLRLNASAIYVQLTKLNSFVIKAVIGDNHLYVELFFDEKDGWLEEAVVNIFQRKCIQLNAADSFDAIISEIQYYFDIKKRIDL